MITALVLTLLFFALIWGIHKWYKKGVEKGTQYMYQIVLAQELDFIEKYGIDGVDENNNAPSIIDEDFKTWCKANKVMYNGAEINAWNAIILADSNYRGRRIKDKINKLANSALSNLDTLDDVFPSEETLMGVKHFN